MGEELIKIAYNAAERAFHLGMIAGLNERVENLESALRSVYAIVKVYGTQAHLDKVDAQLKFTPSPEATPQDSGLQ